MSVERVKRHFKENKKFYIGVGIGVGLAGITVLVMRSNAAPGGAGGVDAPGGSNNTASFIYGKGHTINVTTVLDKEGRGHPGWPVRNLETKRIFFSQKEAADSFDIPEGKLSGHLNGKFSDVDGLHFERVNLEAA